MRMPRLVMHAHDSAFVRTGAHTGSVRSTKQKDHSDGYPDLNKSNRASDDCFHGEILAVPNGNTSVSRSNTHMRIECYML